MIPPNSLQVDLGTSESSSRPRSRSQSHDPALLRWSCSPWRHRSWADHMDENEDKREIDIEDLDNKPQVDSKLVKVSEKTRRAADGVCLMLTTSKHCFELPKVAATKTPQLDSYIKTEVSVTKSTDRELARIQTFVLDSLTPLTSIVECDKQGGSLSHKEVLITVKTVVQLIWK